MKQFTNTELLKFTLAGFLVMIATDEVYAQSKATKKSQALKMPAAVERQNYTEEKFMESPAVTLINFSPRPAPVKSLSTPKSATEYSLKGVSLSEPTAVTGTVSSLAKVAAPGPLPTVEKLTLPEMKTTQDNLVPVTDFNKNQTQLFEAWVILDDQKAALPVYGTFAKLAQMKESFQDSAKWGFARSALALGLRVQYETELLEMMERPTKEGRMSWTAKAYDHLVANSDAAKSIWVQSMNEKYLNDPPTNKTNDAFYILRGLRFAAEKQLDRALQDFSQVGSKSNLYGQRLYQEALILYRRGQLKPALQALKDGFEKHAEAFNTDELKTKAALLWGRLAFQSREFKQAFEAYRTVPKTSPEWPEAMMEQALTQVLFKDYEGAAGNMFSLHTDFFKKSYAPESYLIRTVGYLNLCQYADAHKVVEDLQRKYKPILEALDKYKKSANPTSDYDLIREFAKNPGAREIHGIARPFMFAWSQDAGFERHQERINQIEDELSLFQDLSLQMVKREREMTQKIVDLNRKAGDTSDKEAAAQIQKQIDATKYQQKAMLESRKSLQAIRGAYLDEMDNLKTQRKKLAAQSLASRRVYLYNSLKHILDQSEVLLYEIYSGAGDHLRYEVAGGKVDPKSSEALKGLNENEQKWKFKGEIWEDELGHFRSSLTNVCAKDDETAPKKRVSQTKSSEGDL